MPWPQKKHSPIPNHAEKVFHGKRWQVLQWEQELFDGTKFTYESLKRHDSASIIPVLQGDKVIILEERQPHWKKKEFSIVGGGIEEGEDVLLGAKRELLEETGATFRDFYLVSAIEPFPSVDYTHYTFIAKNFIEQNETSLDPGEDITPIEVSFDKLISLARNREFYYNPYLIDEYIIRDKIPEFFDMLRNPEKYVIGI